MLFYFHICVAKNSVVLKCLGYTLVEVMVTVSIMITMALFAFPGLFDILEVQRSEALRTDIQQFFELARNQAELYRMPVEICSSRDMQSCGGTWSDGMLMYIDGRILAKLPLHLTKGFVKVRFYPYYHQTLRFTSYADGQNDNGTLWYCKNKSKKPLFAIAIEKSGELAIKLPNKNGEIPANNHEMLACN